MRIEKINSNTEKRILIGMITDDIVCSRIGSKWAKKMFKSKWAELVASWCKDYFSKYGKAPGKNIVQLFEAWALKVEAKDKDTVSLIEKFLSSLSGEYTSLKKDLNAQHTLDLAMDFFSKNQLAHAAKLVAAHLENGDTAEAAKVFSDWKGVELTASECCDIHKDPAAIDEAFDQRANPFFRYPGSIGEFFGDCFGPGRLVGIMAPEKRGKTWWLMDIAWRAAECRVPTAFFSTGDMTQAQMVERLVIRAAKRPMEKCVYRVPTEIHRPCGDGKLPPDVEFKEKETHAPMTKEEGRAAIEKHRTEVIGSKKPYLRMSTHGNSTISVKGIDAILKRWRREGFDAKVVVIDYADILAMPDGGEEVRNQINATWKHLRALSQQGICVVVATQANAEGGLTELLGRQNFSEDKRKLAHVTEMFGINQNEETEKELQVFRLNWIVRRSAKFQSKDVVYCAGCLDIGNPVIKSTF